MSVTSQAIHLLAYDLLRTRWWIAAFSAVLGASVVTALDHSRALEGLPYLVILIGMITAVIVVQGDSPYRTDAFWRGRAVHPAALLLSKSLTISVLFVLLPIFLATLAAATFGVPRTDMARLIAPSVPVVAMWVVAAVLFAMCTHDIKSAAFLCFSTLFGWFVLQATFSELLPDFQVPPFPPRSTAVTFVGIAAAISAVYLGHLSRRKAIALSILLAAVGVSSTMQTTREPAAVPTATAISELLEVTAISLKGDDNFRGAPYVRIRLQRERPGVRYALSNALMTAHFTAGDSVSVPLNGILEHGSFSEFVTLPAEMQWRTAAATASANYGALVIPMFGSTSAFILGAVGANGNTSSSAIMALADVQLVGERVRRDSVTHIQVHATIARYVLEDVGSGPFATGVVMRQGGRRIVVRDTALSLERGFVVDITSLGDVPKFDKGAFTELVSSEYLFVLQHAARAEATMVHQQDQRRYDGGPFVVPGVQSRFESVLVVGADAIDTSLDPTWLGGATLRVLRWKREGQVQLSSAYTLR